MHPEPQTMPALPGLNDYLITVPVRTPAGADAGQLRLRLPAGDPDTARQLAATIVSHLADTAAGWHLDTDGITVTATDSPTVDELAAQVEHWRRMITAVVAQMPMLVTYTQFQAADPDLLIVQPAGPDTMMLAVPSAYPAPDVKVGSGE
jgi:hypothetical protein